MIAAGTGLGFAALVRGGGATVSLASEGGHADFAPRGDLEMELVRHLQVRFGHVSCERVVSGPGLLDVYLFLRDTGRGEEPPWLAEEMRGGDPSAAVSQAGLEGRSPLCALALDTFLAAYGAEAGNWALRTLATGGVFLGGGIAAKVFCGPRGVRPGPRDVFLRAFLDKGRMRPLLEATPVRVIVNDRAALIGSAHLARREARRGERGAP